MEIKAYFGTFTL